MNDPRRSSDEPAEIADAGALFDDGPATRPAPKPKPRRPSAAADDGYAVEGLADEPDDEPVPPPIPVRAAAPRAKAQAPVRERERDPDPAKNPFDEDHRERPRLEPSGAVEEVWTRGAEWSGTLVKLVLAGLAVLGAVYVLLTFEQYGLAFLALLLGLVGLALLAYPIVITLERPVRITPEQAARDFYGALAHHVPHYKRMWLLLSNAGRVSRKFASFDGFQTYWKRRMAEWKKGKAGAYTPLKFQVVEFHAEKSAGKTVVDAKYKVNVYVRGKQGDGPIDTVPMSASFVKGSDNMWYLDVGTLP